LPAEIKWPNDILIRGRKAAGILAEMRGGGRRRALILGIGVNVNQERSDFPPELVDGSTSLRMESGTVRCREDLAGSILRHLSVIAGLMYHDGWPQVREDWIGMAPEIQGTPVRIRDETAGAQSLRGITEGVDDLGALIVRLEDGSKMILHSSESLERLER
jgi:BirA family biotin operon repressor/biotin-[acetyl-CoA-carboxylase] ligase